WARPRGTLGFMLSSASRTGKSWSSRRRRPYNDLFVVSGLHSVAQPIAPEDAVHAPLGESGDCERGIDDASRPVAHGCVHYVQALVALHATIAVAGLAQDGAAERVRGPGGVERERKRPVALIQAGQSLLCRGQEIGEPGIGRGPVQVDGIGGAVVG